MNNPLLIIPSYISKPEHLEVLRQCIKSIRGSTSNDLLIIDDQSPELELAGDFYFDAQQLYENIDYDVNEVNSGFATTVNVGLRRALEEKRDAVLINADIEFRENGWLDVMGNTDADIVGALLIYPVMVIQHAGIYFSSITRNFDHRYQGAPPNLSEALKECECPVTGALQYIKLNVLEDIGLYDEEFFLGHEDVDFCLRALYAGHKSLYNPKVKAIHYESLFRSGSHSKEQRDSYLKLVEKHQDKNFYGYVPTMMEVYE